MPRYPIVPLVVALLAIFSARSGAVPIHEIQGPGIVSPLLGAVVTTSGVVTAVDSRGFWLQDPVGDGDFRTSDGIFVYSGRAPSVRVGDEVAVTGRVDEHLSPWIDVPGRLTTTEIVSPWPVPLAVEVRSAGNAVPVPVVVGSSGRRPPTEAIRPGGIDFWESLEGMLVTVPDAAAVAPRRRSGELAIVADRGAGSTGLNSLGGLTMGPTDENPEWILVRRDPGVADVTVPFADVGDLLGDVTGVVGNASGAYEILATRPMAHTVVASPPGAATHASPVVLRMASYNVWNLDPGDPGSRFAALARQIVENLGSPHVLALQEIQDDDGAPAGGLTEEEARAVSSVVSAGQTYALLLDAIEAAGGPRYAVTQVDPLDDRDGGVPGGNIRVAFLWDPARVTLAGSASRIPGSEVSPGPFDDARKPLAAEFRFNGRSILVINAHLSSRYGSVPLYGVGEPTVAGLAQREAQARFLNDAVERLLAADPGADIVLLGDLNSHWFESPLSILSAEETGDPVLWSLSGLLDPLERWSYIHGGGSQQLDHALVSRGLTTGTRPGFEIVHLNAGFHGSPSDHDPILVSLWVPEPAAALLFLPAIVVLVLARVSRVSRVSRTAAARRRTPPSATMSPWNDSPSSGSASSGPSSHARCARRARTSSPWTSTSSGWRPSRTSPPAPSVSTLGTRSP